MTKNGLSPVLGSVSDYDMYHSRKLDVKMDAEYEELTGWVGEFVRLEGFGSRTSYDTEKYCWVKSVSKQFGHPVIMSLVD